MTVYLSGNLAVALLVNLVIIKDVRLFLLFFYRLWNSFQVLLVT